MPPEPYTITSDAARVDVDAVHRFLRTSYWASGVPREVVERSIKNSLLFCVFRGTEQVGFARVVTDRATFAYLADVYVLPEHGKRGLAKRLMQAILEHPELRGLRRWMLGTRDAHGLYSRYGFKPLANPDRFMELHTPGVYQGGA